LRVAGTAGFFTGRKAQWPCHGAPCSIQRLNVSICGGVSFLPDLAGGIRSFVIAVETRFQSFALLEVAGDEGRSGPVDLGEGALLRVEPEVALAAFDVRPVALDAVLGEQRRMSRVELDAVGGFDARPGFLGEGARKQEDGEAAAREGGLDAHLSSGRGTGPLQPR